MARVGRADFPSQLRKLGQATTFLSFSSFIQEVKIVPTSKGYKTEQENVHTVWIKDSDTHKELSEEQWSGIFSLIRSLCNFILNLSISLWGWVSIREQFWNFSKTHHVRFQNRPISGHPVAPNYTGRCWWDSDPPASRAAVPSLFGTRDWFHGSQFFHGPGLGAGMAQAVTRAMGSDGGGRWSFARSPFTSCCATGFLAGCGLVWVCGPRVGDPWSRENRAVWELYVKVRLYREYGPLGSHRTGNSTGAQKWTRKDPPGPKG